MLCFNVWIAPAKLVKQVQALVTSAANCLANAVVDMDESWRADDLLSGPTKDVLRIGSPNEYLLELCCEYEGLPDGAAKHLLGIANADTRSKFAALLREFADVSPA